MVVSADDKGTPIQTSECGSLYCFGDPPKKGTVPLILANPNAYKPQGILVQSLSRTVTGYRFRAS